MRDLIGLPAAEPFQKLWGPRQGFKKLGQIDGPVRRFCKSLGGQLLVERQGPLQESGVFISLEIGSAEEFDDTTGIIAGLVATFLRGEGRVAEHAGHAAREETGGMEAGNRAGVAAGGG